MVAVSKEEIREDAELFSNSASMSSHRNLYKQHPQQENPGLSLSHQPQTQPTFDEWEAAIVKSMSERPDEIIDILERYAEEREQLSMREGDEWYTEEDEEYTADESREDTEGSAQRDAMSTRSGWSSARESFVASFVEELRTKVARLTYESSMLVSKPVRSDTSVPSMPEEDVEETKAQVTKLQADLNAEMLKSESLALHLEESKAMYETQLQEMWERIQWLESRTPHADGQETVCKMEEASQMEMTEAAEDDETVVTTNAKEDFIQELQDKVSVLTKAMGNLTQENEDLKEALSLTQKNQDLGSLAISSDSSSNNERVTELEIELENAKNELLDLRNRCKNQEGLLLRSEDVLEMQRKQLDTSERALMKTRELYEHEKSARHSIERINDTTQVVLDKLHRKVAERKFEIDQLKCLLVQEGWEEGHEIV